MSYWGRFATSFLRSTTESNAIWMAETAYEMAIQAGATGLGYAATYVWNSRDNANAAPDNYGWFEWGLDKVTDTVTAPVRGLRNLWNNPLGAVGSTARSIGKWAAPQIVSHGVIKPLARAHLLDWAQPAVTAFLRPFMERFAPHVKNFLGGAGLSFSDFIPGDNPWWLPRIIGTPINWIGSSVRFLTEWTVGLPFKGYNQWYYPKTAAEYGAPQAYEYGQKCADWMEWGFDQMYRGVSKAEELGPVVTRYAQHSADFARLSHHSCWSAAEWTSNVTGIHPVLCYAAIAGTTLTVTGYAGHFLLQKANRCVTYLFSSQRVAATNGHNTNTNNNTINVPGAGAGNTVTVITGGAQPPAPAAPVQQGAAPAAP